MADVGMRELQDHDGDEVDGASYENGRPVGLVHGARPPALAAEALLRRWRRPPHVDADALRADVDELLDPCH